MDLATLVFKTDTSELERANNLLKEIGVSASQMDVKLATAQKRQAQAEKLQASARLDNAKALEVEERAQTRKQKATEAATAATEKANKETDKATGLVQKQVDILTYQTQGWSRGQSSLLAYAKSAGVAGDQMKLLQDTIETQRKLMSDPFDASSSGLKSLQNQYRELTASIKLYNDGVSISSQQARDYARDRERITLSMRQEGKSIKEIQQALAVHKQEYIDTANNVNRLADAQKVVQNQRREIVSATKAVVQEDQRMAAALSQVNSELSVGATDRLVKYENNLKKMGLAQDVVTQKLTTYKAQLRQVQAQEEARASQHLARSLSPQLTDIAVSLYSGQAPLTVLLQQGGQIADLFRLSGVEAANFGKAMRDAFTSMIPVMATVAKGMAGFVGGVFLDAGKGLVKFTSDMTGMTAVVNGLEKRLIVLAATGDKMAERFLVASQAVRVFSATLAAVGVATLVGAVAALAIGFVQTMKEQDKLAESLARYNGTLSISHNSSMEYVNALTKVGVTTGVATEAITAMAKAGVFSSDEIMLVAKSAAMMAEYSSTSVEDTVKVFAKLKEKPVEALIQVAKETGMVSLETIKMVEELEKSGKAADASALAMKTYGDVTAKQVEQMKDNYSTFGMFIMELGRTIKQFFSETFKDLFYTSTTGLQKEADKLQALVDKYEQSSAVERMASGDAFGYTNDANKARLTQLRDQIASMKLQNAAIEDQNKLNAESARLEEAKAKLFDKTESAIDKQLVKTKSLAEYQELYIKKKTEETAKSTNINAENIKWSKEELDLLKQKAKIEWGSKQKKPRGSNQDNRDLEREIDLMNKAVGLSSSYNNDLDALQRRRAKGRITEQEYITAVETLIKQQPFYIQGEEEKAKVEELRNKLLGQSVGLGKEYYKTLEFINEQVAKGNLGADEAQRLLEALEKTTPAYKEQAKFIEANHKTWVAFVESNKQWSDSIDKSNTDLAFQYSILGKSEDEVSKMRIEHERIAKITEVTLKYEKERAALYEKVLSGELGAKEFANAENLLAETYGKALDNINSDAALKYAQEFQKQFDSIRNGITDSIVTALFEGGKAGRKKFRDLIVNELKKPVTLVVNAVVNTLMGSVIGALTSGAVGSAAGGVAGSVGTSVIGSAAGGILGGASSGILGGLSQGFGATMTNGLIGGFGVNMSNIGTLLGGGQFSAALGAAAPYLLPIVGVLSLLSGLDDSGTYHTGGAAQYSAANGLVSGQSGADFNIGFGRVEAGAETISAVSTLSKSLVEIFDGIAKTFGKTAGYEVATAFADDTSEDGAWGALAIRLQGQEVMNWNDFRQSKWAPKEFGDGEAGYQQYLAAIAKDTRQVILDMDLPSWAEDVLTEIGDSPSIESLTTAVTEIAKLKAGYDDLTSTFTQLISITDDSFGALVELAGGIDNLTTAASSYYQNFYSEAERAQIAQDKLTAEFGKLGLTLPTTREGYRALVEAQDVNTESGRSLYLALLNLSGSFAEVVAATEDATDTSEEYADAVQAAYDVLSNAVQAQVDILNEQVTASEAVITKLKGIFDLLDSNVRALYQQVDTTSSMLASQGRDVITQALSTGAFPEQDILSDAISSVRNEIENASYATQFEADKARLQLAGDLAKLRDSAESQLTTEELILKGLKDQLTALQLILDNAKSQLDAVNGVNTSVLSVDAAVRAFHEALAPSTSTGGSSGGTSSPTFSSGPSGGSSTTTPWSYVSEIEQYLADGRSVEPDALRQQMFLRGWTLEDMSAASGIAVEDIARHLDIPAYASGGMYQGGLALVGEDGPEFINFAQGGQVYNANQTSAMLSGSSATDAISALGDKVSNLEYALQAIALNTGKLTKIMERVTPDGDSILITDAATL